MMDLRCVFCNEMHCVYVFYFLISNKMFVFFKSLQPNVSSGQLCERDGIIRKIVIYSCDIIL